MKSFLLMIIASAGINNIVTARQVGVCALLAGSGSRKRLFYLGGLITTVIMICLLISGLLRTIFLKAGIFEPTVVMADALIALLVSQLISRLARRLCLMPVSLSTAEEMLISAQTVLLAVILSAATTSAPLGINLLYGLGSGLGWMFVAIIFEPMRRRLDEAPAPAPLRGLPLYLIGLGLLALASMGLAGLD